MKQCLGISIVAMVLAFGLTACQSRHETGVKSDLRTQWTSVDADAPAATDAAKAVLTDEGLKDVKGKSTSYDGEVTGKMADGTKVTVSIKKQPKASMSDVSVTVGTVGNPTLGANLAKKIKMRVEGGSDHSSNNM